MFPQTFDSIYFRGKSHFKEDGTTDIIKGLIISASNGKYINFWNSEGLSDENVTPLTTNGYILIIKLGYFGTKTRVELRGSCFRQDKITYNHGKIVNIYIVNEIKQNYNISRYLTLENCLFGAVSLTKNVDIDKYKCSGYGIVFDRKGEFSFGNGIGRNVIIFEVGMSSSQHIDNKILQKVLQKDQNRQ